MASEGQGFQGDANVCSQNTAELGEKTATLASAIGTFDAGGFQADMASTLSLSF